MGPLTEQQTKVMHFIALQIRKTGLPPTLREIAAHFGWKAVGTAQDAIAALRRKGALLPPEKGKARQILPSEEAIQLFGSPSTNGLESGQHAVTSVRRSFTKPHDEAFVEIPLLGLVQAGNPIEAIENANRTVSFPLSVKTQPQKNYFALTVEGFSMLYAGFLPGDYLLIESAAEAKNGDIVVASLGGTEVTVKRFAVKGSMLYRDAAEKARVTKPVDMGLPPAYLLPENVDFDPLPFGTDEQDRIVGLVRSLFRREVK